MSELSALLRLAGPIVLSQLGQMLLGTVDMIISGTSFAAPYVAGTLLAIRAAVARTGLVRGLDTLLLDAMFENHGVAPQSLSLPTR